MEPRACLVSERRPDILRRTPAAASKVLLAVLIAAVTVDVGRAHSGQRQPRPKLEAIKPRVKMMNVHLEVALAQVERAVIGRERTPPPPDRRGDPLSKASGLRKLKPSGQRAAVCRRATRARARLSVRVARRAGWTDCMPGSS